MQQPRAVVRPYEVMLCVGCWVHWQIHLHNLDCMAVILTVYCTIAGKRGQAEHDDIKPR